MKKVIICSGGVDSITALYNEIRKGHEVIALSFDYGSKHNAKEIPMAQHHCKELKVKHEIIKIDLAKYFKSSLLQNSDEDIPEGHYADENMKSTVVPFRNGIMLSIAVGYAESIGAKQVVLGSHAGDHSVYPDCRDEFTQAISLAAQLGTYEKIKIVSPFNHLMKWDIVKIGHLLKIDYGMTYSCYEGKDKACGKCGTCVERLEAFEKVGLKDPIEYKN